MANSDATKKAFAATIKAARASAVLGLNMDQAYRDWPAKANRLLYGSESAWDSVQGPWRRRVR